MSGGMKIQVRTVRSTLVEKISHPLRRNATAPYFRCRPARGGREVEGHWNIRLKAASNVLGEIDSDNFLGYVKDELREKLRQLHVTFRSYNYWNPFYRFPNLSSEPCFSCRYFTSTLCKLIVFALSLSLSLSFSLSLSR